jgi:hypothetical protein
MRKKHFRAVIALLLMVLIAACGSDDKKKETPQAASEATLSVEQNTVELRQGDIWTPASASAPVRAQDAVRTDANGQAVVTFYTGTQVEIRPNSELVIESFEPADGGGMVITLNQITGETLHRVELVADSHSRYEVDTPVAHLTVRGTEFAVAVAPDGATRVSVTLGVVQAEIDQQTIEVQPGQALDVTAQKTTTGPYEINPILPPDLTSTPTLGPTFTPPSTRPAPATPPPNPTREAAPTNTVPAISIPQATPTRGR